MLYLQDYCALIMSGLKLYNGTMMDEGLVAVYGKDEFAHTLIKSESFNNKDDLKQMLSTNTKFPIKITPHKNGPIDFTVCVPTNTRIKGLEQYLWSRGFGSGHYEYENAAAKSFLEELDGSLPGKLVFEDDNPLRNPMKGRQIASAVTIDQVSLTGKYGCASSKESNAKYHIQMNSPLDMGRMNFKAIISNPSIKKALVYINGHLRILTSSGKLEQPFNEVIWDIKPKLDHTESNGLMNRKALDILIDVFKNHKSTNGRERKIYNVLLGCYKDSRD